MTDVNNSGAELPAAMKVAPATSSLRCKRCRKTHQSYWLQHWQIDGIQLETLHCLQRVGNSQYTFKSGGERHQRHIYKLCYTHFISSTLACNGQSWSSGSVQSLTFFPEYHFSLVRFNLSSHLFRMGHHQRYLPPTAFHYMSPGTVLI